MYMKRLKETDRIAFRMLAHCGNVTSDNLFMIGLTESRIKTYRADGFIRRVPYKSKRYQKEFRYAWALTEKGRNFIRDSLYILVANSSNAVRHNVAMADEYSKLISYSGVKSKDVLAEHETRAQIEKLLRTLYSTDLASYGYWYDTYASGRISAPDIVYKINNEETYRCIEIVTSSYNKKQIEAKSLAAKFLSAEIDFRYI